MEREQRVRRGQDIADRRQREQRVERGQNIADRREREQRVGRGQNIAVRRKWEQERCVVRTWPQVAGSPWLRIIRKCQRVMKA